MLDSFIKKVTFKDDTGKKHSYIATFVKVDGGYKISDEDMQQINEAMHKGATWEDTSSEDAPKHKEYIDKLSEAIDVADGKADNQLSVHEMDKEDGKHDDNIDISNLADAIRDRWQ